MDRVLIRTCNLGLGLEFLVWAVAAVATNNTIGEGTSSEKFSSRGNYKAAPDLQTLKFLKDTFWILLLVLL